MIAGSHEPMHAFLEAALPHVKQNYNQFKPREIGDVLTAYAVINPEESLFELFEAEILELKSSLLPVDIETIVQAFTFTQMGSAELFETFDKIIGKNIKQVTKE